MRGGARCRKTRAPGHRHRGDPLDRGAAHESGVPPDEHPWIEEFGATASYRTLRRGIRDYYRAHLPLTPEAHARSMLNPGNSWVSRLCHDPRVAVAVLHQMMAPHQLSGRLIVMHSQRPIAAWSHGDRVAGVVVKGHTGICWTWLA
jgi:hypothetical protein